MPGLIHNRETVLTILFFLVMLFPAVVQGAEMLNHRCDENQSGVFPDYDLADFPVVSGSTVFVGMDYYLGDGGNTAHLAALDIATGELRRVQALNELDWLEDVSPFMAGNHIVIAVGPSSDESMKLQVLDFEK